jgi:hypothetical protein
MLFFRDTAALGDVAELDVHGMDGVPNVCTTESLYRRRDVDGIEQLLLVVRWGQLLEGCLV